MPTAVWEFMLQQEIFALPSGLVSKVTSGGLRLNYTSLSPCCPETMLACEPLPIRNVCNKAVGKQVLLTSRMLHAPSLVFR